MTLVAGALKQLEKAIPEVGTEGEAGVALMKCVEQLRKHFPADSVSPGMEKARQERFMMQARQESPLMNILKMAGQGGAGGAPPGGAPPGGAPPGADQPS